MIGALRGLPTSDHTISFVSLKNVSVLIINRLRGLQKNKETLLLGTAPFKLYATLMQFISINEVTFVLRSALMCLGLRDPAFLDIWLRILQPKTMFWVENKYILLFYPRSSIFSIPP